MKLLRFLARLFKHRWLDAGDALQRIGREGLDRLQAQVASSELTHSGEIRICVEAGLPSSYLWREASTRERALAMFGKLRVWDTERNNGVLIYLLLAERRIEIVADRGLGHHASPEHWQQLTHQMSATFRAGQLEPGLSAAVEAVHKLLAQHFPLQPGERNINELPDAVVLR